MAQLFHGCNRKMCLARNIFSFIVRPMKQHMTLNQWCEQDGRGPSALARALGVSRTTLWRLRHGDHAILPHTARQIELATGGLVRAAVLLGVDA
jgi:transcriptional regulator with XRE-family HTH domain